MTSFGWHNSGGGELDVVCTAPGAGGQYPKSQFFSVDGATTFHPEAATPPADGGLDELAVPGAGGLVMATASAGSTLFELQGETWAVVAHPATGGIHWHDLGFTTESQGVAVLGDQPGPGDDGAGLYMTRDGGRTWALIDFGVAILPPPCPAGQLTVSQPSDSGAAGLGNEIVPLLLTNHGARPCSLDGYPGLSLIDASGQSVANSITRSTSSYFFSHREVEPVVLAATGGTGAFFVSFGHNPVGNATTCPHATEARVIPPAQRQSVSGPVDIPQLCGGILISPIVAGTELG